MASCVHCTACEALVATSVSLVMAENSCFASQVPYSPAPDWYADLRDACGKAQVDYHLMRTDEPVEKALGVYLTRRQRQK